MVNLKEMAFSIFLVLFIVFICALVGYIIFSPFIYTLAKCKGTKRFAGLKYSLLNLVVGCGSLLIFRPLTDLLSANGNETGKDLADGLNIIWLAFWLYISFGVVMKKVKRAVTEPDEHKEMFF